MSLSIEGYTETLKGEVHQQHPARTWVDRQEQKSGGHEPERIPTTRECEHHLLQMVTNLEQGSEEATGEAGWKEEDPSRYPQQMCRGLARLLSHWGLASPRVGSSVEGEGMWRARGYTS